MSPDPQAAIEMLKFISEDCFYTIPKMQKCDLQKRLSSMQAKQRLSVEEELRKRVSRCGSTWLTVHGRLFVALLLRDTKGLWQSGSARSLPSNARMSRPAMHAIQRAPRSQHKGYLTSHRSLVKTNQSFRRCFGKRGSRCCRVPQMNSSLDQSVASGAKPSTTQRSIRQFISKVLGLNDQRTRNAHAHLCSVRLPM